jgi:hypothetical protein
MKMKTVTKHMHKLALAAACGLALSTGAQAANLTFTHADADDFQDIRATDQGQGRFEERVLKNLEEHFQKEAAALPAGHEMRVTLTDINLAGFIEYPNPMRFPMGLRVIRNVDFPQMSFTYEVRDESGELISSGEEELSGMSGFRFTSMVQRNADPLRYEKAMISEWFDRNFAS